MRAQIVTIKYTKNERGAEFATIRNTLGTCFPEWLAETKPGTISSVTWSGTESGAYKPNEKKILPSDNPQSKTKHDGLTISKEEPEIIFAATSNGWGHPSRKNIPIVKKHIEDGSWGKIEINRRFVYTSYTEYHMKYIWITNESSPAIFNGKPDWELDFKENLW